MNRDSLIKPLKSYFNSKENPNVVVTFNNRISSTKFPHEMYCLKNQHSKYYFEVTDSVRFFEYLKQKYPNQFDMMKDFDLSIDDLTNAIKNELFLQENGCMAFLKLLGAERVKN